MLQNIRDNMQGLVARVIIGLVIVTFALFGADAIVRYSGSNHVAEVNGEKISEGDLQQAIILQKRQILSQMGENADPAMLEDSVLRQPALDSLVNQRVLLSEAERASIKVSDTIVNAKILQNPSFQEDGVFSKDLYQVILRSNGFTPKMYKDLLSDELTIQQLNSGLVDGAFVTARELDITNAITLQERDIRYITLSMAAFAKGLEVSDQLLKEYYEANQEKFYTPESVVAEYLELNLEDFFVPVEESVLQEQYELDAAGFESVTERRVSHILLEIDDDTTEEQAKAKLAEIRARVEAGDKFSELAKSESEDLGSRESGGDLGFTKGDTFPASFEVAISNLEKGELSEVFTTDGGAHLVQVTELTRTEFDSFEDAKEKIKTRLQKQAAESVYLAKLEQLGDLTYTASDLGEAAEALEMQIQTSGKIEREGFEGIASDARVLSALYSAEVLKDKNNSNVIELSDTHAMVVRVKQHYTPELKAFDLVKADIEKTVRSELAEKKMAVQVDALLADLKSGAKLEGLAKASNLDWSLKLAAKRNDADVPGKLLQAAFEIPDPGKDVTVVSEVQLTNGDKVVYTVNNVTPGSAEGQEYQSAALKNYLARAVGVETLDAYREYLKGESDIDVVNP
jgi:peptidyl-prolyl cis-trans isomerase D